MKEAHVVAKLVGDGIRSRYRVARPRADPQRHAEEATDGNGREHPHPVAGSALHPPHGFDLEEHVEAVVGRGDHGVVRPDIPVPDREQAARVRQHVAPLRVARHVGNDLQDR